MITDVTNTATTASASSQMKQEVGLNKDDFLKLFVTQLQNQDPLNPQDSSQYISQLAQITQVEQAYNTNTNLQSLLSQGNNSTALAAISLVGKQVEASGSQVNLTGGATPLNFKLDQPANTVYATVTDSYGNVVKTVTGGSMSAGENSLSWDGTDSTGKAAQPGIYNFSVNAMNAAGSQISTATLVKGTVTNVDMTGTTPSLTVGGIPMSLTNVTSVGG